ncbi:uncharacterized protein LOC132304515 isoform X2 [Cornus florida]|uniref:uncharacterized protein LOC132304515 isoform X2 n=1 Tax=Cornus florida TaxID=4283 RepID=UPI00289E396C|nr:uncharacterized protein LOC132304515 isoform X2 [Cornus florida]
MAQSSVDAHLSQHDKCWAGICLLGVTCQECNSNRFLSSYTVWFQKLQLNIQSPAGSHFVKVASCVSMSDLFTRLGEFPNAKKDGTSHAAKLVQPVLKLLNEESSNAVWEGAICLLCTITTFFPSSVHRHYDSAEAAIVSKIMSGKCSFNLLKKLGHCLALLPKSRGDEDSWSLMMQKILLSINTHLNDAFQGLEDETASRKAMTVLLASGKDPPPPLGGQTTIKDAPDQATKRPERLLMSSVSTLMLCCCTMLTSSYPVQVTIPVRPLLNLAERVLMVDGSLSQALFPYMIAMQQEFICSELPVLHLYSLELLTAIVKGLRSQLLPHVADIIRLLKEYFGKCALPELRIKLYSIIRILLISLGVGTAIYLTQDVINNVFVDLEFSVSDSGGTSNAYSNYPNEAMLQPCKKKRKHATTTGAVEEQPDIVCSEAEVHKNHPPNSVKIAALETLEALLTVGGSLRSESWRANIDRLLIDVATYACKGGWAKEEKHVFLPSESTPTWADFQLAALRALLASLLSPARVRPPYLAQGLELFRRGMQETGTKLAEFCAHALLALEVLIHPRAFPLIDFPSAQSGPFDGVNGRFQENICSGGQKQNTLFASGTLGKGPCDPDSDDELFKSWLGDDDEIEVPVTDPGKSTNDTEEPLERINEPLAEKLPSVGGSSSTHIPEEIELEPAAAVAAERNGGNGVELLVDSQQSQEPISQGGVVPAAFGGSTGAQFTTVVLDSEAPDPMDSEMAQGKDVLAAKGDGVTITGEIAYASKSNSERNKGFVFDIDSDDSDSSTDSFPDIVNADPDSD